MRRRAEALPLVAVAVLQSLLAGCETLEELLHRLPALSRRRWTTWDTWNVMLQLCISLECQEAGKKRANALEEVVGKLGCRCCKRC